MSGARRCAFAVLRRVFERGAWADRALHSEAAGLSGRDRALATRLAYGAVQRRATLDHVIERLSARSVARLQAPVRAALRLGIYELVYTSGAPARAIVHDAVELAKRDAPAGARLVNAVLRRADREGAALVAALSDATPEQAALAHSLPAWVVHEWWAAFGASAARELMARANLPAESALRANTLRCSTPELRRRLPVPAHRSPGLPEGLVLEAPFDAHGSALWEAGAFMPQSRGSMLVARAVAPVPGDRVLDLCAAPGAKTTHLAALMGNTGTVVAVERHPGRARALRRTVARLGAECVQVRVADAGCVSGETFDRVLVDAPCSGLGTLAAHPDLRWHATLERRRELVAEQRRILEAAARAVRPGGLLVYSTCTLSAPENEDQVGRFLARHPEFSPAPEEPGLRSWRHPSLPGALQMAPHRHGSDGFFIARLLRKGAPPAGT